MSLGSFPKLLILTGIILIAIGLFWHWFGRNLPLGKLPGDIAIEKEKFRLYFPIATSLLLSAVISLILYLFRLLNRH